VRVTASGLPEVVTAGRAAMLVADGATVGIEASGGGVLEPGALIAALGDRFTASGAPRDLTLFFCSGVGDGAGGGADLLAHPGLLRRVIGAHFRLSPALAELAESGEIEGHNLPQGVLAQLLREIGGGRPGVLTRAGLGTFVDPRRGGGRINERTVEELVEVVEVSGEEWLLYRSFPIDVVFLRGTTADTSGNVTVEREAARLSLTSAAIAARNSGGTVVVQVERLAAAGTLRARDVVIPGHLVDYLVVDPDQWQTAAGRYNPSFSGEARIPLDEAVLHRLDERTVVGRRALAELRPGWVVNLGVGMADTVATAARRAGRLHELTLTIEQGLVGGMPAQGLVFGVAWNPDAIIDQHLQFDFYDGGGLDCACLGFAEVDAAGNVNASRIAGRVFGTGGFINISQGARRVVFCGSFTSGGLEVEVGGGRLRIIREGRHRKFPPEVAQLTFDAATSLTRGGRVRYVTERAVFDLTPDGLELIEIAPGVDLQRDVLGQMGFTPGISRSLREMDPSLFEE
jgi:acyl CoA:acetate/3-ketoacid CoA transferase